MRIGDGSATVSGYEPPREAQATREVTGQVSGKAGARIEARSPDIASAVLVGSVAIAAEHFAAKRRMRPARRGLSAVPEPQSVWTPSFSVSREGRRFAFSAFPGPSPENPAGDVDPSPPVLVS